MYLVDIFAEWHKADPNVLYVILGPVVSLILNKCSDKVARLMLDGIIYMNELSQEDTHACMRQSFSLVNSSISEGMAAVILEAMDLCIPVIARQNDGNCSLISNGNTGFIYNTPQVGTYDKGSAVLLSLLVFVLPSICLSVSPFFVC
ncbi:hypothetical protein FSP39_022519 [Pinctada imbricata]|uniref:Glycosyl transferase family 1 domain-containing protein n=1 Tax=Pinctada imbricata TaxID=66713 RepID=A0AA88XIC8_PINIB|nr:hypothetical protein FSP39_022519 [Pinctada imbricata]